MKIGVFLSLCAAVLSGCATNSARYEVEKLEAGKSLHEIGRAESAALPSLSMPAQAPFAGWSELRLDELLKEVNTRNPSLAAKHHAWRAAVARYPQVTSFEDPMVSLGIAPGTILDPDVGEGMMEMRLDPAFKADVSQKIPWPGKLTAKGEIALEQARAIRHELDTVRLELDHMAGMAYYEYWFAFRALEVNARNRNLLNQFKAVAESKYSLGQVTKQDALQAEVELDHLTHQDVILKRRTNVARSRMNTLMNRPPDEALPPPNRDIPDSPFPGDPAILRENAVNARPELQTTAARLRAAVAALELAEKEFFPDLTVMGTYNRLWELEQLRSMIGVGVNLPVQRKKRHAAVEESMARIEALRAELAGGVARVSEEVQIACEKLIESHHVIVLYGEHLIPTANESLRAAQSGYETGRLDFLRLLSAQRELLKLEVGLYQAHLDHEQRIVDLERALGAPVEETSELQKRNAP